MKKNQISPIQIRNFENFEKKIQKFSKFPKKNSEKLLNGFLLTCIKDLPGHLERNRRISTPTPLRFRSDLQTVFRALLQVGNDNRQLRCRNSRCVAVIRVASREVTHLNNKNKTQSNQTFVLKQNRTRHSLRTSRPNRFRFQRPLRSKGHPRPAWFRCS